MADDTNDTGHDAPKGPVVRLATAPRWLPGPDAAAALGVSLRTLQRKAAGGEVEREQRGRRSYFRVSAPVPTDDTRASDTRHERHARHERRDTDTTYDTTRATNDAMRATVLALTDRLADAERRAAVAEYRAELAEADPDEVEALRAGLEERDATIVGLRAELADVRAQAEELAAAMVKRHGIIKRLAAKVRTLHTQGHDQS